MSSSSSTPTDSSDIVGSDMDFLAMTSLDMEPRAVIIAHIRAANDSIRATVYKFNDKKIFKALKKALKRGVAVKLLLDEEENKGDDSYSAKLDNMGAKVRYWSADVSDMYKLHAKLLIVDKEVAVVGSSNWTHGASRTNLELLMTVRASDAIDQLFDVYKTLWRAAK